MAMGLNSQHAASSISKASPDGRHGVRVLRMVLPIVLLLCARWLVLQCASNADESVPAIFAKIHGFEDVEVPIKSETPNQQTSRQLAVEPLPPYLCRFLPPRLY
jgi:hypothetical protein